MVALSFDLAPGEKLDFTFDFSEDLDAIGQTIEGTPTVVISPASPVLTLVSTTVLAGTKKVAVVLSHASTDPDVEWSVICPINATGSPDRDFKKGIVIRSKPTPPAAVNGLTTVARVVTELGITDAAKQALVADYINEATAMINNYCGRTFHKETGIVETVAGYGTDKLIVEKTPILSITSVAYDGVEVAATDYEIFNSKAGLIYSPNGWADTGRSQNNASLTKRPGSERKSYTVTYTGGYVLPGSASRTLPYDIERACIATVQHLIYGRKDASVKSESVPGVYSVEYSDESEQFGTLPAHIAKMLGPYRRLSA